MAEATGLDKPDLTQGISDGDLADGVMLVGRVGEEAVLLARKGNELFAIGATCTHYGGPLGEGLMVEDTVRCPWHHACFSMRTGEALAAHALNATSCWRIERRDGRIFVREQISEAARRMPAEPRPTSTPAATTLTSIGGKTSWRASKKAPAPSRANWIGSNCQYAIYGRPLRRFGDAAPRGSPPVR